MSSTVRRHLEAFAGLHVVVVGDLMVDEFVRGDVARISPEAPVPILEVTGRTSVPGGAANAASNIASLGARATVIGVVGDDRAGHALRGLLDAASIDGSRVVTDASRATTEKTRIVARNQQVVRIDQESRAPLAPHTRDEVTRAAGAALEDAHACVISDYGKGVVSPELVDALVTVARRRKIPVIVDPKRKDFGAYRGATVITPNLAELEVAAGGPCGSTDEVVAAGERLLPLLDGGAILVTRGAAGMTLLEPAKTPLHTHARARAVFDVTGAGDTVVGTLTLALAAGMGFQDGIELASVAAGLVVSKVGTATVTINELAAEIEAGQAARG